MSMRRPRFLDCTRICARVFYQTNKRAARCPALPNHQIVFHAAFTTILSVIYLVYNVIPREAPCSNKVSHVRARHLTSDCARAMFTSIEIV